MGRTVLIRCRLGRGAFSGERTFVVNAPDGGQWRSLAPVGYCYGRDLHPLRDGEPADGSIDGLLVGLEIGRDEEGLVRVELPNGQVYHLDPGLIAYTQEWAWEPVESDA